MLSDGFENKVQKKMEEFTLSPAESVWEKVEAALPVERKRRPWFIFLIFFGLITTGSLILWRINIASEKSSVESKAIPTQHLLTDLPAEQNSAAIATNTETASLPERKSSDDSQNSNSIPGKLSAAASLKNRLEKEQAAKASIGESGKVARRIMISKTRARVRSRLETPIPENEELTTVSEKINDEISLTETSVQQEGKNEIAIPETTTDQIAEIPATPYTNAKLNAPADTLPTITKKEAVKKQRSAKWTVALLAGAGLSNTKSGLFENSSRTIADFNSIGGQTSLAPVIHVERPKAALTVTAGFIMERAIAKRWKLLTGLNYSYQSNNIKVGNRVDSSTILYFNNSNVSVGDYYRYGNAVKYTNRFHLLQMPVLLKYSPFAKLPVYIEAGPVFTYLLHTNALVYNHNTVYFNDRSIFNKPGLSFAAGVGFKAAKNTRFPIGIGYRFNYSLNSVIISPFAKQHLLSSLFFITLPVKK